MTNYANYAVQLRYVKIAHSREQFGTIWWRVLTYTICQPVSPRVPYIGGGEETQWQDREGS